MPIPPTIITAKRRLHRRRRGLVIASPPPPAGLQVIGVENVVYDEPILSFTVVFNTTEENPLVAGELDPAKWSAVYQGGTLGGYDASVSGFDRINVQVTGTPGPGGASTAAYANDPSDVSDTLGRTLAAFEGFPM